VRQQEAPRSRRALHFFDLATTTAPAKELRVSCLQDEVRARFDKDWRDSDRAMLRVESWAAVQQFLGAALSVAIFGVALVVLYRGVVDGQVKAGGIFLVLGVMTLVIGQLGGASDGVGSFGRTARVIEHLLFLEDLGRESRVKDRHSAPDSLGEGVTLENVSFRYHGSANDALSGVSLTLSAGSVVALVGENGAGKSTLVKLLFGLYRPTGGNVLVDGVPLESIEPVAWRSHTAACFQDFARLELSVRDSVGCGDLARPDDGSIVRALERADATGLVNRLDDGLDAVVGATLGGRELSGGEWQKLAIARGMVRPTPLLLALDEPTSALDPLTEERLFDQYAIRARSTDTSCDAVTIVVSHRFSTVRMADVIVVLDNGRVVEVGAHSELINRSGKYAELYRLQAQYYR
jgi:ABC-type multidrug transport system fused ATPase/permease subunit